MCAARWFCLGTTWLVFQLVVGEVQAQVLSYQKISTEEGKFTDTLDIGDHFGSSVARLGDFDGDGVGDIAVGVGGDDDGGNGHGGVWILFLNSDQTVKSYQKISDTEGGFTGVLDELDWFGESVASLGDLDGDGVVDLAVGAYGDDDGGLDSNRGAVWVLFLNSDGTVKAHQKISSTEGSFSGVLDFGDQMGISVATLGDLDGDTVVDIAVGAFADDDLGPYRGAVWVLFLNSDGTVKGQQKINDVEGGFTGSLGNYNQFGTSLASLGDLDGDGIVDLAVSASGDGYGAVWVLFLNNDGTVKAQQKISATEGGFSGIIESAGGFGGPLGSLGDIDGDGVTDLAVGAVGDDDGGQDRGAVWILFLNSDGTVKAHQKISDTQGNFDGTLDDTDRFGSSVTFLGDLDGDGKGDLAAGAWLDDDGGLNHGALWVLFLDNDGTVLGHAKIDDTQENFAGTLDNGYVFGASLTPLGDLDGDGIVDLAVAATGDAPGAVWVLFLNSDGTVKARQKISDTQGHFSGAVDPGDGFGWGLTSLGDVDGDGVGDLAVGSQYDDDGGPDRGAVWVLFLNADGTVKTHQKISDTQGNFSGALDDSDWFGTPTALGDLDGDGIVDMAVGAYADDDGGSGHGAVWVLFLNSDGTVKAHQKISDTEGNFTPPLDLSDEFGFALTSPGDIDGDGVADLAVAAHRDDDGGSVNSNRGAVWVLFLNSNGTVKAQQKISDTEGNFTGVLKDNDLFGHSLASPGDVDKDGVVDLAVGAVDDDGGYDRGAVWILFLNSDGSVKSCAKISDTNGHFTGTLDNGDMFGGSIGWLGDLNGDGVGDIAVGAPFDDDGGIDLSSNRGAVWVLFLDDTRLAVAISSFDASAFEGGVALHSSFASNLRVLGVNVYRAETSGPLLLHESIPYSGREFYYEDHSVVPGSTYRYQIGVIDPDGEFYSPVVRVTVAPLAASLTQNTPNPFNPTTTIAYVLPEKERAVIRVYDASGRRVRTLVDGVLDAGSHEVTWDGRDDRGHAVASGVYFYRLEARHFRDAKKMLLLK